ncbi:hypothetical protein ZIOFF_067122 [Zingiber officinale]|uniref:Uncharacterized protein n=1 Tax=Zingiber officinale TaxID=94328 RepID=A0A8J5EDS1_ZINOF|nr:hypothetical protein ZIOFF_067122 [Zingiber officinale]
MGGQPKATTQQQTTPEVPNHMEENFALTEHFLEFSVQMAQLRMRALFFWLLGGPIRLPTGRRSDDPIQDLSNNNIGGGIPENLPLTLHTFFLSANQFTGSIPSSLSQLTLLTDMSINNNQLSGDLPDVFSSQTGLINLDLSFNNFSGPLPASMGNLSSLTTFHVQNNQLSGLLNVLEDLPLINL